MISGGTYLYYVNSWLLAKGGYLKVFETFCWESTLIILALGVFVYSLGKNKILEKSGNCKD